MKVKSPPSNATYVIQNHYTDEILCHGLAWQPTVNPSAIMFDTPDDATAYWATHKQNDSRPIDVCIVKLVPVR